ncbi:sulfatase [Flagellimonas sp. 389]|uniref:sulfatase family protein n=1 Tax=Flagellimonas sp. 389 TaxID=2835862 RepID=UPI001BD487AC|nr:sulfatase [Flagellimonas sp. 389]MBS9462588.1 sulfatase [Flagellimonas sp. 389]
MEKIRKNVMRIFNYFKSTIASDKVGFLNILIVAILMMSFTQDSTFKDYNSWSGLRKLPELAKSNYKRPNILLILADDWSYPHASAYGDKVIKTPNFDRIAKNGFLFTNAFAASPSCTPSRAALLTGRYPHALKESGNLWGTLSKSYRNYVTLLEKAGYIVGFQDKGWGPGNYEAGGYTRNPSGHEEANFDHFFKNLKGNQPFCFWFGTRDPHRPYASGLGIESGMDVDAVSLPDFYPKDSIIKADLLDYYYEIQRLDYDLGRILFRLERTGMLENTLIVVTSDNGMPFPRAKANCYDLGTRVPLAISWGNKLEKGIVNDNFINLIDLAPTFLEAAQITVPKSMQGESLLSLLLGEKKSYSKNHVFLERERHAYVRKSNLSYPIRAVRDSSYLFVHNLFPDRWPAGDPLRKSLLKSFGDIDDSPSKQAMLKKREKSAIYRDFFQLSTSKRPEFELYHIPSDQYQTNNLVGQQKYNGIVEAYRKQLRKWRTETQDVEISEKTTPFDFYPYFGKDNNVIER